jgi:excisionase family DNA binding protein
MPVSEVVTSLSSLIREVFSPTLPDALAGRLTVSIKEASALTGLTQRFISDAIERGDLSVINDGRRRRLKRKELESWVEGL